MAKEYEPAEEVRDVANLLIMRHHDHLGPVRIEYVFLSEALIERGKVVWARTKKIAGLNAWLAQERRNEQVMPEEFFVIEVAKPIWLQLDAKAREALIDHELTHCWVEDGRLSIRPHDLEEFNSVVRRHGLWRAEVELFLQAADPRQQGLGFDGPRALREVAARINSGEMDEPGVTVRAQVG